MHPIPQFPCHPRKNDALFMFGATQRKPYVFVYTQQTVEVICGPSCRRADEINLDRCLRDDIPIVERRNGGGTVVLGPGMVITIIVGERNGVPAGDCFNRVHTAMIAVLHDTGIHPVNRSGISDLSMHDRKILGSSLYLGTRPPLFYYQSSLLVAPDLSLFDRYLHHPPREPGYRRKRSHGDFCTSLAAEGYRYSADDIRDLFAAGLARSLTDESTEFFRAPGAEY